MVVYVSAFCRLNEEELTQKERNILNVAYKSVVGARRAAWRTVSIIQRKEKKKGELANVAKGQVYKKILEKELTDTCQEILDLLNTHLLKRTKSAEGLVFLTKMKGDYYRYMSEYSHGEQKNQAAQQALNSYEAASTKASESLESTNPIRLGLALNYSVYFYEIKKNAAKACKIAREAFDEAIADLDDVEDRFYKDATLIMQLLRDNLTLWTEEVDKSVKDEETNPKEEEKKE